MNERQWKVTVGLEVHAELATTTKMFCSCKNDPDEERPNVNVCPVCLAHPGTLPVINREAVRQILRMGKAVGGTLARFSEFDRKSYFYPDIPKGYQISQYEHPFVLGGELAGVAITRVHLEEDTARSTHESSQSLIDFNRAGVPLMELVTEPVIHDAVTAGNFARELQLLLRTLGAGEANLEKGEMRIEANISVSQTEKFGTKVEVKNLNSFRSVERAIEYEIKRQVVEVEKGGKVVQETRGWDEGKQQTFAQRLKEGSADYRYFPEPDLPKILRDEIPEFTDTAIEASLPELPSARRARYAKTFTLSNNATSYLVSSPERSAFFDEISTSLKNDPSAVQLAANYIVSDLAGIYAKSGAQEYAAFTPASFAALIEMIRTGELSSRGAKDVLAVMAVEGGEPTAIATAKGFRQVHDEGALAGAIAEVIQTNQAVVEEYRAGKEQALQFLLGQAMKATKGAGNPAKLREMLLSAINS